MKQVKFLIFTVCLIISAANSLKVHPEKPANVERRHLNYLWQPYTYREDDNQFLQGAIYVLDHYDCECPSLKGWQLEQIISAEKQQISYGIFYRLYIALINQEHNRGKKAHVIVWQIPTRSKKDVQQYKITRCYQEKF